VPDQIGVVGAGPAGAWTAFRLARGGARVVLFDPSHPREKPCGGGLTGRALALVADARVALPPLVNVRSARFIDSQAGTECAVSLDRRDGSLGVASRQDFDGQLVSAACDAGATLVADRVRSIAFEARAWRIETASGRSYRMPFLVAADGANSFVRRQVAAPFRPDQLSIATGFFAFGKTSDEILIEFTSSPPGYIWSFPRRDHLAVGICAQVGAGATSSMLRAHVARWMASKGLTAHARLEPYAWPIPSLSVGDLATTPLGGSGYLFTGDAAGLVDPITREGIFFALQSASFAAEAILSGTNGDRSLQYQERARDEIIPELTRAARLKDAFFRPRFIRLMLKALASSERVRLVMADLLAGAQPYRDLKWRLAGTFEIGLAVRALRSVRD
jgi:geranylgeranyl reductase family protein